MTYDAIVIGAGPSGVSAAIYLKRAGLNVLVIYKDGGSLSFSNIRNFYGYLEEDGKTLFAHGLEQLKTNNILSSQEEVIKVSGEIGNFIVKTDHNSYYSFYLLIATGISRKNLPQFALDYLGNGVSTCALCDGPLYRKKKVYVTGKEPYLANTLEELSIFTDDINKVSLEDILSLKGDGHLEEILLKNGKSLETNNLFIALPFGSTSISNDLGVMLDSASNIIVDQNMKTNIKGVYAIGDATPGLRQVTKAAFQGMVAALAIVEDKKHAQS